LIRIGIVFTLQEHLTAVAKWTSPAETLSYLLILSLLILHPIALFPILPVVLILANLFLPAFTARHTAPQGYSSTNSNTADTTLFLSSDDGPALSPPPIFAKPAPVESRDFLLNMKDIQNMMAEYSDFYDKVRHTVVPLGDFSNERTSSTVVAWAL